MAVSLTCTNIVRRNGVIYVRFSDNTELEFDSVAAIRSYVRSHRDVEQIKDMVLRPILLAKMLEAAADGSNAAAIEGKTITLDLSLPTNLMRLT